MIRVFETNDKHILSYSISGAGPTVVLLPGGPGIDPAAFFAGTELPGFTQVLLFPRGTGKSEPPDSDLGYRIEGYVSDVEQLRRHLELKTLRLYGSSHGASIALAYASAYPAQVDHLVLASGPAKMDKTFGDALTAARERFESGAPSGSTRLAESDRATHAMRGASTGAERRAATRTMIDTYLASPDERSTLFLDDLAEAPFNVAAIGPMMAEMMGGLDLLNTAATIAMPTLILAGDLDVRVPAEHMRHIAQTLPNAQYVCFPNVGHLIHAEIPDQWSTTVGAFFSDLHEGCAAFCHHEI